MGWDPRSGPRPELFLGKKQRGKTGQEKQFCPTCSVLADPFPSASCPSRNLTAPKPEPSAFFMLCCGPDPREGLDALSCRCSEFSQVTLLRCWWLLFFFNEKKAFFHLLLYKAKPLKSFCSVSPPTHTDGCMGGTAGLRRL